MSAAPLIELEDVAFAWRKGVPVLELDRFTVRPGEKLFLRGASGSGKSTLLGLVCGVLTPDRGRVLVAGHDMGRLGAAKRDAVRAAHLGVIFQMFNLLPYLSVVANVVLPCRFSAQRRQRVLAASPSVEAEALRLLERLGLGDPRFRDTPVRELSVGQQQRVAAARALIGRPALIVADEPTSALDADSRDAFLDLLVEECAAGGAGLLFVSHDGALARHFDRAEDMTVLNRLLHRDRSAAA